MKRITSIYFLIALVAVFSGCQKFVALDPPDDRMNYSTAFATNSSAASILNGLYIRIAETSNVISQLGTVYMAFSADELKNLNLSATSTYTPLYQQNITANNELYWNTSYTLIYHCNAAIEGLEGSNSLSNGVKTQLLGEAKFMRALFYYYMVNTYGKVPLLITTDYRKNMTETRAEVSAVYAQMIDDLKDAQTKLSKEYLNADASTPYPAAGMERARPTYWAATALLARVYLYDKKWAEAEAAASIVIANTGLFFPVPAATAFLKNTKEAIYQIQPVMAGNNSLLEPRTFVLTTSVGSSSNPATISPELEAAFEAGDLRKANWIGTATISGVKYLFPYKYKANNASTAAAKNEYYTPLRIAEQYLIRAEARAQQNKLDDARSDLNVIRDRAGLGATPATTQTAILDAILKERQVELFCEQGHRWFDLQRTGKIDEVMKVVAPTKGGVWESYKQLMPVPAAERALNRNLDQNRGYEGF